MLTRILVGLNWIAGTVAGLLLAPVSWLPDWLSSTIIAVVTGVVMLVAFKQTSNQTALKRTRNLINANLLALSLFKDDLRVVLGAQAGLLVGAVKLLALSLVPTLVMLVPMSLVLGQLALWFQARPLATNESAIVTVRFLNGDASSLDAIQFVPSPAVTVVAGPVRVPGKSVVCWNIQPLQAGRQTLSFELGNDRFTKELAVGSGFMPVSLERPASNWSDVLIHPHESPFEASSRIQSIAIAYPERLSWTAGTHSWLIYWFVISMATAFAVRPIFNVNL